MKTLYSLTLAALLLSACVPAFAAAEELPARTDAPTLAPTPATPDLMAVVGYLESLQTPDRAPVLTAAAQSYQIQVTQIAIAVANQAADLALRQSESQAEQARLDALNMLARTATTAPLAQTQQSAASTQAADSLALGAQGAALVYVAATTATADAGSLQATQTITRLSAAGTEIANNNAAATATEYAQPRNEYTRYYATQTQAPINAAATQRYIDGQEFTASAGRWSLGLFVLIVFSGMAGGVLALLRLAGSLQQERLLNARAAAARNRIVGTGTGAAFAGDNGAQPIPPAPHPDSMRPLINMSAYQPPSQAPQAQQIAQPPAPPKDRARELVERLLQSCPDGSAKEIPSLAKLEGFGNSAGERQAAVEWLRMRGAVSTVNGGGTFIDPRYGTVEGLWDAFEGGRLPTPPAPASISTPGQV